MTRAHLAILKQPWLDMILSGRKPVESRLSKGRYPPFGQIGAGDIVFLKKSSGPVVATAIVSQARFFPDLTSEKMELLKQRYNHLICAGDDYWQSKLEARFGTLIWLGDIQPIEPVRIDKKDWRAWVPLSAGNDFGLLEYLPAGTSID